MRILKHVPLGITRWYEKKLLSDYDRALSFLKKDNEELMFSVAEKKLEHAFKRGLNTPAYSKFLRENGIKAERTDAATIKEKIPLTDKKNYIKPYSYESRCVGGKFPVKGNIDESAGSTGKPTEWIRSFKEEELLLKNIQFEYKYAFRPKRNMIVISAWSTGPWATGIKFCEIMEHFSLVKNTGTDVEDIKNTLKTFGKRYHYIIAGYPFFLQKLFGSDFQWDDYKIDIITGGDAYSPVWPEKIRERLKPGAKIVSSYGCSDIDIGIGFESGLAQNIREEAAKNSRLSKELFGNINVIPMLFQYNPMMHYVHNLPGNGFAITYLDNNVVSPKIKYNVHDIGGSIRFSEMKKALEKYAPNILKRHKDILALPFLFVAGRDDGTISLDGANVFPDHLDIILTSEYKDKVENFKIEKRDKSKRPFHVLVELKKGVKKGSLKKTIEKSIRDRLPVLNNDYDESLENNSSLKPVVNLYTYGKGPFRDYTGIKYNFIKKTPKT